MRHKRKKLYEMGASDEEVRSYYSLKQALVDRFIKAFKDYRSSHPDNENINPMSICKRMAGRLLDTNRLIKLLIKFKRAFPDAYYFVANERQGNLNADRECTCGADMFVAINKIGKPEFYICKECGNKVVCDIATIKEVLNGCDTKI